MPILWGIGVLVGGVVLVLVVLTLTHMRSTDRPDDTTVVPTTVAPAPPTVPSQPCFPFQTAC